MTSGNNLALLLAMVSFLQGHINLVMYHSVKLELSGEGASSDI